jgi:hypothetical protein
MKVHSPTLTSFWTQGYHQACKQALNPKAIEDKWMLFYQLASWFFMHMQTNEVNF